MSRRGAGEGHIYQRKDGLWEASLSLGSTGGRRKRKSVYGKTRREVQTKLDAIRRDLSAGIAPTGDHLTVERYYEGWIEAVKPRLAPRTHARYGDLMRLHVMPTLGRIPLAKLQPADVERLLAQKLAPPKPPQRGRALHPTTVGHVRTVIRRMLADAQRQGLVGRNVGALAQRPKVPQHQVEALEPETARLILEAVRDDRLGTLYTVALGTGLRLGEVQGLRWPDIDIDSGRLHVRQTVGRVSGKMTHGEPKTDKSRRTVQLPAFAIVALREQRRRQAEERLRAGPMWSKDPAWAGLVFTTPIGTPPDPVGVTRRLQAILRDAGLPKMRFHDLRHGFATLMLANGVDLATIANALGHTSIVLVGNLYGHVIERTKADAAARLDQLLTGS